MQYLLESLESRQLFAGVTILTHGLSGSIDGWVRKAATDIANRIGAADTSQYVMKVDEIASNTLSVTSFKKFAGPGIDSSVNAEAIVLLDWTAVDDGQYSTAAVGNVVANYLMSRHKNDRPLANFPLHFIGHSRGASLLSNVASRLGSRGIWVDQATYLDSHPVNGGIDDAFIDFGDPQIRAWDNVTFVDNYWRSDGLNLEPDGQRITGAHEGNLNNTVGQIHKDSAHLAVTAYYDGTINLNAITGGDEPIFNSWYGGKEPDRDATGYAFSRLGGKARPTDGLRVEFGGTAIRAATVQSSTQWGNVDDLQVLGGTKFTVGQKIPLRIKQQDRDDAYTITLWMDRDRNPYNDNNVRKIRSLDFAKTSNVSSTRLNGLSAGVPAGSYYIYARITDAGGHARYTYSRRITLV